jgi:transposase
VAEFKIPLNLPDVEIIASEITETEDVVLTIKSTCNGTHCYKCGKWTEKIHGYDDPILIRHLPVLGNRVYLKISLARYVCSFCDDGPTTTERLSWRNKKSAYTKAYEKHVLLEAVNSTIEDVCIKEGLNYKAVLGIIDRNVAGQINWSDIKKIDALGIDEIALRKGHKNFVVIISARVNGKLILLGVLKDRKKETVKDFLRTIPQEIAVTLGVVCCDMYDGFINAVKEVLGKEVKVVIDRFHVTKHYRNCLEKLRKKELRRLKQTLPKNEYKKLSGVMWALRKNKNSLNGDEKSLLNVLFEHAPQLRMVYDFQNELTALFDMHISKQEAIEKINTWIECVRESGIKDFDAFIETLKNSWEEILNYFDGRYNSGFVEGLNNKIKVLKRRCYGIFNLKHLFQRICLDLGGYEALA